MCIRDRFHARCADSLLKLFEYMIRMDVTEAACVTHGGVIMSLSLIHIFSSRSRYDRFDTSP